MVLKSQAEWKLASSLYSGGKPPLRSIFNIFSGAGIGVGSLLPGFLPWFSTGFHWPVFPPHFPPAGFFLQVAFSRGRFFSRWFFIQVAFSPGGFCLQVAWGNWTWWLAGHHLRLPSGSPGWDNRVSSCWKSCGTESWCLLAPLPK